MVLHTHSRKKGEIDQNLWPVDQKTDLLHQTCSQKEAQRTKKGGQWTTEGALWTKARNPMDQKGSVRLLDRRSRAGVAYWTECHALVWPIGPSVAPWCALLGRASCPSAVHCRTWGHRRVREDQGLAPKGREGCQKGSNRENINFTSQGAEAGVHGTVPKHHDPAV